MMFEVVYDTDKDGCRKMTVRYPLYQWSDVNEAPELTAITPATLEENQQMFK